MGATPQGKDITIEFECQFRVDLQNSDFFEKVEHFLWVHYEFVEIMVTFNRIIC